MGCVGQVVNLGGHECLGMHAGSRQVRSEHGRQGCLVEIVKCRVPPESKAQTPEMGANLRSITLTPSARTCDGGR